MVRLRITCIVLILVVIFAHCDRVAEAHPHREIRVLPIADDPHTIQLEKEAAYRGATRTTRMCTQVDTAVLDHPEATMEWCQLIGQNLFHWGSLNADWLQHNMNIVDCESDGKWWAKNPKSTATGIYQHVTPFRDPRAIKYLGRPVISWRDAEDNIMVGVALYVDKGPSHWPNCGRR